MIDVEILWVNQPPASKSNRPVEPTGPLGEDETFSIEQWRWDDLMNDPALKVDYTDGGFNWTQAELEDAIAIARASLETNVTVCDMNMTRLEQLTGLQLDKEEEIV